ncbi:GNAT family N-acetyltransferase [Pengzhenrongella frigida]|uniref:GNAT family N-acetyltransferase n=1 Tax=Pengzhenrongella frigida TaxID=1259133 RepID=UPI0013EBE3FE|nr:GNAT family N-acetyltransferase [Cellulomonas sp. HLT2-17]
MSSVQESPPTDSRLGLRASTDADRDWLSVLHEQAHRDLVERAYGPWIAAQQREFFAALVDEHTVFVLTHDSEPVGAVYLGERDGDLWLELLEISPAHQGRGFGTFALDWIDQAACEQGRGIRLQVHLLNEAAHRLYLKQGFTATGETPTHHHLRKHA